MPWQDDFLAAIGAPNTPNNQGNVNAWAACEGGMPNNNPFNTTKGGPGAAGSINSVGVKRFDTLSNGVAANVATIQQSNFSPLLNALKADASRADFAATLGSVPWGTDPHCVSKAPGTPVGGGSNSGSSGAAAPSGNPLDPLLTILMSGTFWIRVLEIFVGAIALVIGIYLIFSDTQTGQKIKSEAKGAAKDAAIGAVLS